MEAGPQMYGLRSAGSGCIAYQVYSLPLALALYEKGIKISMVNLLQIKRFAQTKLKRTKTDQVDAALITPVWRTDATKAVRTASPISAPAAAPDACP